MKHLLNDLDGGVSESRGTRRSQTMLAAQLTVNGGQYQVRVRNLSQTGAFVEAPVNAGVGTSVTLHRAGSEVSAVIARTNKKGLGLVFDQPLDEATFDTVRTGKAAPKTVAPNPAPGTAKADTSLSLDKRIARELQYAQRLLDHVTDPLVNDYVLVSQYARNLQEIDRLRQLLGHLANILGASDKEDAIEQVGILDLRCRLQGKPLLKTWAD